jgi:ATP-binding cassette subfamily F protein 3
MIARLRDLEGELGDPDDGGSQIALRVPPAAKTGRIVMTIEGGAIGYDRALATGINLSVERGQKIAVIGANGIGKSTLLKTIKGLHAPLAGKFLPSSGVSIGYFAQDQAETLDRTDTVLGNLLKRSTMGEREARGLLGGFLFRGNDVFKQARVLSGGEMSRLGLAILLGRSEGLLLLDEPTNHLDMASVEMLADALTEYDGTMMFVSHDRTFIDAVATHVFAMLPDGRSMLFEGKLADYQRLAATAGFPNVLLVEEKSAPKQDASTPAKASDDDVRELKKRRQKLEGRINALDTQLAKDRTTMTKVEQELAEIAPTDFAKAQALTERQTQTSAAIDAAEEEWLVVAEELETVKSALAALNRL